MTGSKSLMRTALVAVLSALVITMATFDSSRDAEARRFGFGAFLGGAIIGGAIASASRPRYYYPSPYYPCR